jgi:NosR/NirI family nitrous oxide reductase transcriptional regulator
MVSEKDYEHPSMPGGSERIPFRKWAAEEVIDHMFPWSGNIMRVSIGLRAAGISLAIAVTTAWLLAASGSISSVAVISWWTGWSVYEIICRRRCKPWVKQGPWWQRQRRPASLPDLIFYVATKNLIIGIVLFLIMEILGLI